jgi:hypothetical protein
VIIQRPAVAWTPLLVSPYPLSAALPTLTMRRAFYRDGALNYDEDPEGDFTRVLYFMAPGESAWTVSTLSVTATNVGGGAYTFSFTPDAYGLYWLNVVENNGRAYWDDFWLLEDTLGSAPSLSTPTYHAGGTVGVGGSIPTVGGEGT